MPPKHDDDDDDDDGDDDDDNDGAPARYAASMMEAIDRVWLSITKNRTSAVCNKEMTQQN